MGVTGKTESSPRPFYKCQCLICKLLKFRKNNSLLYPTSRLIFLFCVEWMMKTDLRLRRCSEVKRERICYQLE